jgi:PKD repeat protein
MAQSRNVRRGALLALACCLLAILATMSAGTSRAAAAYGELTRIGGTTTGTGNGQLNEERTRLLGVDSTDNSVYVLDEPQRYSQAKEPVVDEETKECEVNEVTGKCTEVGIGPITRHFRLQKFTAAKSGAYSFAAAVSFDEVSPEPHADSYLAQGVEGIAVDPKLKRVYLLTVDDRETNLSIDNSSKGGGGIETQGLLVAATLHAFSTEAKGAELVGAPGTKETAGQGKGVLAGPAELQAQSVEAGKALLQPTGITIDPATDEVIILGHVDEKGEAVDNIASATDHYVLQRITQAGAIGARYLDKTNFLKEGAFHDPPDSPIVIPGATEHVYVNHEGLTEVPYSFASAEAPHRVSTRLGEAGTATGPKSSNSRGAAPGGVLSVATDGTVYATGEIRTDEPGVGADFRPGVLALSGTDGSEIGWTGGQTPLLEGNKDKCAVQPGLEELIELPVQVAAGSAGTVFVLNPEFLKRWEGEELATQEEEEERAIEGEKTPGPHFAGVIEFGPGGAGCPQPIVSLPVAEVSGKQITEKESLPAGTTVTFSSTVKQADALKVKWEFSNGTVTETETVSTDQFRTPTVKHKFEHEGQFTVKETIETDNLATPLVTVEGKEKVVVSGSAPPPPAAIEGPATALVGQAVEFTDPNPSPAIKTYKWSFGDGTKTETEAPAAKHAYAHPGVYTVELAVANAQGKESAPASLTIKVSEAEVKEEPKEEPKHEETPTPGPGPTPAPGPTSPPNGGVKGSVEATLVPNATLAGTSLAVSGAGAFVVKVSCPAGETTCTGTVTLRTIGAVSAAAAARKSVLTLAVGSFSVAGGRAKAVTMHLSAKARKLLARSHVLRAKATIAAHDTAGSSHTSQATVTLRASKPKH